MELLLNFIPFFLLALAVIGLVVGVSNDAVNFLNSAIGAKAAPFKLVLGIAAVGIFLGAILSNGMMEIARSGIYDPGFFTFEEVMIICLAMMLSDVVLLHVFNLLGLPTSTTVSMVFELLGAAFCMAILKIWDGSPHDLGELINTSKAISVIIAIFTSVGIAFFFGSLVQWITRVIFSFNYTRNLKYFAAIFGGISLTAIIYFMLIKGLKDSAFMDKEMKQLIHDNTWQIVGVCLVGFTAISQILHWLRVNVLKLIVLAGTLALALAFAGNDLVNFIGVPLAGLSAWQDYVANGNGAFDSYLMVANRGSAHTEWYFLVGSGLVMVLSLLFSKSSQNVIKTSVNLSRQDDGGEETFGSSKLARGLVRLSHNMAVSIEKFTPKGLSKWIDTRFNKEEIIMEQGAAFDLLRASVNLVVSSLLIALGTSMKLPLSTTYVTFMVAMGSSLADRAWSRESAVGRITGVMNVVGGWFITAGAAFIIAVLVSALMKLFGAVAIVLLSAVAIYMLIDTRFIGKKKNVEDDELFVKILDAEKPEVMWPLLSMHVKQTQVKFLENISDDYLLLTNGFLQEDFRTLNRVRRHSEEHKRAFKSMRRKETLCLRRMNNDEMLEKNMWFHLGANAALQAIYAIERSADVCSEHVGNNFNPLPDAYKAEFIPVRDQVLDYIKLTHTLISSERMEDVKKAKSLGKELKEKVKDMRKTHMKRTHKVQREELKVSLVYMNMLLETNEVLNNLRHLISYSQNLQEDGDDD